MLVVQNVFRASAALRASLEREVLAPAGSVVRRVHDALLPVGLGAARGARGRRSHGRLATDGVGHRGHARAPRPDRAPRSRVRRPTALARADARRRAMRSQRCSRSSTDTRAPPAACSNPRSRPSSRGSCASSSTHPEEIADVRRHDARHRSPHGRPVPRRPEGRRPRDLARWRAHRRCRLAPEARRRGALDGRALRLPARAPRRDADALADDRQARQRDAHRAEEPGRSRAPAHRDQALVRAARRHHGPLARLPERHVRAVRGAGRRVGAPRQRARGRERRELPPPDARPRPLDDPHADQPAGRPLAARCRGGRRRDLAAQGRRVGRGHHRPRRAHARHARALRGRDLGLPGQPAAPAGHSLRPLLRDPDEHPGAQGDPARQLREGRPAALRLPAQLALRRAGRRGDLRRRARALGSRLPRRRHDRPRRGHQPHATGAHTSSTRR